MLARPQQQRFPELQYVRLPSQPLDRIDLSQFPDFLILGPQRTGSTWLAENLRRHPEIFFTSPKEIFFFNKIKKTNDPRHQSDRLEWYLQFFKDTPQSYLQKTLKTIADYGELYRPRVRGEGTASYAALDRDLIREITLLNPSIKAILIIRNPVNRAWSHAKKGLLNKNQRELEDVPEQEFIDFFHDAYQQKCGNYTATIERWLEFLPPEQLLMLVFDDIVERPQELLLNTFKFLGVRSHPKYINEKVAGARIARTDSPSKPRDLPPHYQEILDRLFADEIARLEVRFGRRPQH